MVKDNKIKFNQAINVISIGSASYKNLVHILKSFFGKAKDWYLFMNFITAILLSSIAKCLPIHVLGPPPNPANANPGKFLH